MTELVAARSFDVRTALARKFSPTVVDIDPQTAQLSVRIPRPTTPLEAAAWPESTLVAVRVGIEVDGRRTGLEVVYPGGIQRDRKGNVIAECGPVWNVETGFYGAAREDPAQWSGMKLRRLGETGTVVRAWAEVEILNGTRFAGTIAVDGEVRAAPDGVSYHRSVAIENSTSGGSGASEAASATITSFTANTGTNRAAFVCGNGNTGNAHSMSNTYGGASPTLSPVENNAALNSFDRNRVDVFKDSEIGSGAKNIVTTSATNNSAIIILVAVFSGVDQTTPFLDVQQAGQDSGTSLTVTHTTGAADEFICSFHAVWNANATPNANQTEFLSDINIGASGWGVMNASTQVPTTDLTPGWSWTGGNESCLISFVVNAATSGFSASGTPSLPFFNTAGTAVQTQSASGAPNLPKLNAAGTAVMLPSATGAPNLPKLNAAGSAIQTQAASGTPSLPFLSAAGVAVFGAFSASGAPSLPFLSASGSAVMLPSATGTPNLPKLNAAGSAVQTQSASGVDTLPFLSAAGVAVFGSAATGSGTPSLPFINTAGVAAQTQSASGTPSLPFLSAAGTAIFGSAVAATGAPSLPFLSAAGVAVQTQAASGTPSLPFLSATGAAVLAPRATGAPSLPFLSASGAAAIRYTATGAANLPRLGASGVVFFGDALGVVVAALARWGPDATASARWSIIASAQARNE